MTLCDAGPLVSLLDSSHARHADCVAAASLIAAAEALTERRLFTVDGEFRIYRLKDGRSLELIPG